MRRYIIAPVFIPMAGCPHRCTYCNQAALHPRAPGLPTLQEIEEIADLYFGAPSLPSSSQRSTHNPQPIRQIAFYGGSFSGLSRGEKTRLLQDAGGIVKARGLDGVRVSTRPDLVTVDEAGFLAACGVRFCEVGAQSFDGEVLARAKRGHTGRDVGGAVRNLRAAGMGVSIHLMAGLPGASPASDVESARRAADLGPDAVRIHPTLVLTGSALEEEWRAGRYAPLTLDEAVARCAAMMDVFAAASIPVIRVGLHGDDELVSGRALCAGPFHPNFRDLVVRRSGRTKAPPGASAARG